MKFDHELSSIVAQSQWPQGWIDVVVPYKRLKKRVKSVEAEVATLKLSNPSDATWLAQYGFTGNRTEFAVRLSFPSKEEHGSLVNPVKHPLDSKPVSSEPSSSASRPQSIREVPEQATSSIFFHELGLGVLQRDTLLGYEAGVVKQAIHGTSHHLTRIALPLESTVNHDMYAWRHALAIYVQSGVFFSSTAANNEIRTSEHAKQQLRSFVDRVVAAKVAKTFKRKDSRALWAGFLDINRAILRSLEFEEINAIAVRKILKSKDNPLSISTLARPLADLTTSRTRKADVMLS